MKRIIICADDYGLTRPVGEGIRELVAAGRLSAVSCLANSSAWTEEAARLKPHRKKVDVGLHFNLTLGEEHSGASLAGWAWKSLTGGIDVMAVEETFLGQLDRFEAAWGEPPDFIDGHQHVHAFKGIRGAVFRALAKRYPAARRPWVRRVNPGLAGHDAPVKAVALNILSAGLARAARHAGLDLSGDLIGLYSLSAEADYPALMTRWLSLARPGSVLMCHPASDAAGDPENLGPARVREFHYLRGREFEETLEGEGVVPARFAEAAGAE